MLDQRDFTGKAALHHAVADMEERHTVVQALLAAKAQVTQTMHATYGRVGVHRKFSGALHLKSSIIPLNKWRDHKLYA